ncbi:MAG: Minf_1886 family protein [Planctomycetota bacterium]
MEVPSKVLRKLAAESGYPVDAYHFVQRGLDFTVRSIHGELDDDDDLDLPDLPEDVGDASEHPRHVTGKQLCQGLRSYAIQEYGLLARPVLGRWRVRSCEDFGRMVFAMVDHGLMHKTDHDTIEDFKGVFDFASAFDSSLTLSGRTRTDEAQA